MIYVMYNPEFEDAIVVVKDFNVFIDKIVIKEIIL